MSARRADDAFAFEEAKQRVVNRIRKGAVPHTYEINGKVWVELGGHQPLQAEPVIMNASMFLKYSLYCTEAQFLRKKTPS